MRIAASYPTALTIRHSKTTPETKAIAPMPARAVAPLIPPLGLPPAHLTRYGTPDAGFVMQLIAAATTSAINDDPGRPARNTVSTAYGYVDRTTQPLPPGNRVVRSI